MEVIPAVLTLVFGLIICAAICMTADAARAINKKMDGIGTKMDTIADRLFLILGELRKNR
jgi:hypothetical protein